MKKYQPKIGEIIRITWLDAFGRGTWNTRKDIENGLKHHITCEIVGYFWQKDKNFIVLSMGLNTDPYSMPFLHLEFIPKGAILEIKRLAK